MLVKKLCQQSRSLTFSVMSVVVAKTNFGTNQYGSLSADFGYGSRHDGERYKVHL